MPRAHYEAPPGAFEEQIGGVTVVALLTPPVRLALGRNITDSLNRRLFPDLPVTIAK